MPNLAKETESLRLADAHIAAAEKAVAGLSADVDRVRAAGGNPVDAEEALRSAIAALDEFRRHRALIADTVQGIQDGTLPSSEG